MSVVRTPRVVVAILIALALAGCGDQGPPTTRLTPSEPAIPTAVASEVPPTVAPSAAPTATAVRAESPTAPAADPGSEPPTAWLGVEGGDPVAAALGTYTWNDAGSDAPWLRGSPIRVGANEALVIGFDPPVPIAEWATRYVPADAVGPAGAVSLGSGESGPAFPLPPPGSWTLELAVTFADGVGDARYYWQVDVST